MNKLLHSLPWTLALSLAAQAGETEQGYQANAGETVQESSIETGRIKNKAYYESRFQDISREELSAAMKSRSAVLVDANGTESYARGHLPGALDFEGAGPALAASLPADKNALVVAYCGGPGCSAWNRAADRLEALGYTRIRHFKGGLQEWKQAGLKLEKG